MEKRETVFDFLTQIMIIWGISVLSLCVFCFIFGGEEKATRISTLFRLGSEGISIATLMQFLGLAVIITGLRFLFMKDIFIKNRSKTFRVIGMFISIILFVALFAGIFQWFPINQALPWVLFFICFFICVLISVFVSVQKEKSENKIMQEALERWKEEF